MTTKLTLEYRRDEGKMTSSGRVLSDENGLITEEGEFTCLEFRKMLQLLARTLENWQPEDAVEIVFQRTDHEGLLPYTLDQGTVKLLRTDPTAAIAAMEYPTHSPSSTVQQVQRDRVPRVQPPVVAGHAALADAFGDVVYFRVREHELECPGCGFWGMFVSPGLLRHAERAGEAIKTAFVCPKKCRGRFIVTCNVEWGFIDVSYLLARTKLESFYFPRAWNEGRPWVSRESLQKMYDEYKRAKEAIPCS